MPIYAQSSTLRNLTIPVLDIDYTTLADDDLLQYNSITGRFENQSLQAAGLDVLTTASNVGTGDGIFKQIVDRDLQFKSIVAGAGITLTATADDITIDSSAAVTTAVNIGVGDGIFKQKTGDDLELRRLDVSGSSIHFSIATNGDTIEFTNAAEINTASNVGTGETLFKQKTNEDLEFKSLVAGPNVTITSTADEVTIEAGAVAETAYSYQFTVTFDGDGNLDTFSDLPAGWSASLVGNKITVTHSVNRMPKNISYWGFDNTNGWQLRFPNAGFQATIPFGSETTSIIIDINSTVAGADASSTAKVNVIF